MAAAASAPTTVPAASTTSSGACQWIIMSPAVYAASPKKVACPKDSMPV